LHGIPESVSREQVGILNQIDNQTVIDFLSSEHPITGDLNASGFSHWHLSFPLNDLKNELCYDPRALITCT
jgi:hypothetical protein